METMERLTNTKVVQKCELYYDVDDKEYLIGYITREFLLDRLFYAYVFDIDKDMIEYLKTLDRRVTDWFIPGLDLDDYGYYQAFSVLPFFIEMRVIDGRRSDVDKYLKMYGMKHYDAFTMFLRTEGRSADKFHVKEISVE